MLQKPAINTKAFIGRELGTVTLLKVLGQGANGVVFAAFQRTLKRQVAVKVLPKSAALREASRELFLQEAEMVAALNHPNIIPIFEMGEAEDCYYQVMQLVQGSDLESIIEKRLNNPLPTRRTLPVADSLNIMAQVLDGLGYAHDEGVIHQDIKPSNTLIEERTQRPLIADFGIARTLGLEIQDKDAIVGSPLYMAPERVRDLPSDKRSDIYSAGITLYKMLAGTLPLADSSPMGILVRKAKAPDAIFTVRPSQASNTIDAELERMILTAIAADPALRYQDCQAFRDDIERYRATG